MGGALADGAGSAHPHSQAVCMWMRVCYNFPGGLLGTRTDLYQDVDTHTPTLLDALLAE